MAFAVRGKTVWLPPLLLFVSILLLSSFAFQSARSRDPAGVGYGIFVMTVK